MQLAFRVALAQAVLVTFLWSTSWVLITTGLRDLDLPALPFAGLRYGIAAVVLAAWAAATPAVRQQLRAASRRTWGGIVALGVVMYAVTQGAQFVALALLPAASVSLVLSFTPAVVAVGGLVGLAERPRPLAWFGLVLACGAAAGYLLSSGPATLAGPGLLVAVAGLLANAAASLLGRATNRGGNLSALAVTAPSMAIGALLLLGVGLLTQGPPAMSGSAWGIVLWLALVNTAIAFTLWNHTLRTLPATVSATVNNTMLVQIALLAWVFLGQSLNLAQVLGLAVVAVGTLLVSLGLAPRSAGDTGEPAAALRRRNTVEASEWEE